MQEPLVFLPGMICDARVFGPQLTALSPEMAVTVAPITQGDRIEEIASNLLDVLPRKFALAGLSLGGIVAMEVLRRAPDRVSRIALMDTNPLAETPQSSANLEPLIIKIRAGKLTEFVDGILRPDVLAPGPGRAEVMALAQDMAAHLGATVLLRQVRAMQRRRDYQSVLRRCKTPALVLCGEHDGLTPIKRHKFMADLIPYAQLEVIGGAGHLPTLERPDETTQALRTWMKQPLVLQ
ncbi:alpha/beta fold hydrolase [Pseudohalocynthiibacter aestuariivivens]|nr:alpha/beta hydrolase [Pseudohalocynthiibacter aestuariivivens]QIE47109.1 alpha/beta fold hydrolase [Pseudohalocynthiibacter aestuariivivens]